MARSTGGKSPAQPRPADALWGRLKALRSRKGDPSYETMAKGSGLPRSTLHNWFTKHVIPEWGSFVRLLKYFKQDPRRWTTLYADAKNNGSPSTLPGKGQAASQRTPKPPAQLPAGMSGFAGRGTELAHFGKIISAVADEAAAIRVCALSGTAGIGKTTLAIHWSRQVADRFPDGQLYANLRGFEPDGLTMDPAEVIRGFLDAMQVPPEKIATGLDARAAQYRSLLTGRRMLVLLDNAHDAEQVRPLLPAAPGCLVVVTSRNQLTGLVATHGAQLLPLGPLPAGEARELLSRRLDRGRLDADPAATKQIITSCAGLPLALAVVAARAAAHPGFSLRDLAAELSGPAVDLDALSGGDPATDVRTAFASSYHALTPDAARLFRILGLHPGPDLSAPAAASLAGVPQPQVRPALAELTRTQLITEHPPGRYTLHDLLRAYATELATTTDSQQQRHAVTHRLLDHYLTTAHTAALLLNPHRPPITPAPHQPDVYPQDLRSHDEAMTWLSAELPVLLTAVQLAARTGFDTHAWQLAWALSEFLDRRGLWHDWIASQLAALDATKRTSDQPAQARIQRTLGIAYNSVGRPDDAHVHITQALTIYTRLGDPIGQAAAWSVPAFLDSGFRLPVG